MFTGLAIYLSCCSAVEYPPWLTPQVLDAIKQVESGGNCNAISPAGAKGPYQFVPNTWREWGIQKHSYSERDVFDPVKSRIVCSDYLVWIYRTLSKWQGHRSNMDQCLAAYNGGVGNLRKKLYVWTAMPKESVKYVEKIHWELEHVK